MSLTDAERLSTAHHEAAHAVSAWCLVGAEAIRGAVEIGETAWCFGTAVVYLDPPSDAEFEAAWYADVAGLPCPTRVREYVEATVIIYLAGYAAEIHAADQGRFNWPAERPSTPEHRAAQLAAVHAGDFRPPDDWEAAEQLLRRICASPEEASAWRSQLLHKAERLVRNPSFMAIADAIEAALLVHDTLQREEVLAIIDGAINPPPPQFSPHAAPSGYSD